MLSIESQFPEVETMCVDLADAKALKKAAENLQGPIDGLVNNAGIAVMADIVKDDLNPDDIAKQFAVNVTAPMVLSQVIGRHLIKRGVSGSIVNVSSLGSLCAFKDHMVYGASKAALDYATK